MVSRIHSCSQVCGFFDANLLLLAGCCWLLVPKVSDVALWARCWMMGLTVP